MAIPEILIFSDGNKRVFKPDCFNTDNFVLQLLGLKQYKTEINLLETPVYRDLQNNITYFRDILPVSSTQWDVYMNAVRYGDVKLDNLDELKNIINIFGGDPQVEQIIHNIMKKETIEHKYLFPSNPEENIYDLYTFKQANIHCLSWPIYENYTVTQPISDTPSNNDKLYWLRKSKN